MLRERATIEEIIRSFADAISTQGVRVQKVLLFGSYARGNARPESDIDLIVVSPDFAGMPAWRRWEILGKAAARIMEPVEALAYSPEEVEQNALMQASFLHEVLNQPETVEYQF